MAGVNKREVRGKPWVYLYLPSAFLRWSLDSDPNPNLKLKHAGAFVQHSCKVLRTGPRKKMSKGDYT